MNKNNQVPDFNTAQAPNVSPPPDAGLLRSLVEQQAGYDAASGAYDEAIVKTHEGALPAEREIHARVDRIIVESGSARLEPEKITLRHEYVAKYVDAANHTALGTERAQLEEDLDDAKKLREEGVAELKGEATRPDGSRYHGHVPPKPHLSPEERNSVRRARRALRFRPARVTRAIVDFGATIAFIPIEAIVISGPVSVAIRTDNYSEALLLSVSGILGATFLPHFGGQALSKLFHHGRFGWRETIALFGIPAWIGLALLLANVRTDAAANTYRNLAASTNQIAPSAVDMSGFEFAGTFLFWFAFTTAVGCVILAIKLVAYNPVLTNVIKTDNAIAEMQLTLVNLTGEIGRIDAQVAAQKAIDELTVKQYDEFEKKVLPALRPELIALYRTTFINALAKPSMTGPLAYNDKAARMTAVAPATERDAA